MNDPTLSISGRIYGDASGLDPDYSQWAIFVNGMSVGNYPIEVGEFSLQIPVGHTFLGDGTDVEVEIRTWFTWDSDGSARTVALEIHSIDVSGGYDIFYDEDPVCQLIGDQYLTEDGGGLFVPLLSRCVDDRGLPEDLDVSFTNSDSSLVEVSLDQGEVRISLQPEQSGLLKLK